MASVLDRPTDTTWAAAADDRGEGRRLQALTTAVRLHIRWPGVRKTLSPHQKQLAAGAFDAERDVLSATKKLLDTAHPAFKAVSAIRTQTVAFWRQSSLPFTEPGVRLVRRQDVEAVEQRLRQARAKLAEAVEELDRCYAQLVTQARERLGELFDPGDYPASLADQFEIAWDYPSLTVPDYLRSVSPEVYQEECRRVRERFDEAVRVAEEAFAEELAGLVSHLVERLGGEADGRPKIFRDTAVANLEAFFDRFSRLNLHSDEELDRLVEDARSLISGVSPEALRNRPQLRERVAAGLQLVEASLDAHLVNRPRRNVLRGPRPKGFGIEVAGDE